MRVHKFGGASIKDVEGVKRVADIIKTFPESGVVVVVSAMGKTTNLLEEVVHVEAHFFRQVAIISFWIDLKL